jgi:hypothetical protein
MKRNMDQWKNSVTPPSLETSVEDEQIKTFGSAVHKVRKVIEDALGTKDQVIVKQAELEKAAGVSHVTFVRYLKQLRESDYEIIGYPQYGTVIKRRKTISN